MKKLATALVGAALIVTLAGPAEAAVASRPASDSRIAWEGPPDCYGLPYPHSPWRRACMREHGPRLERDEHDGNSWLLFSYLPG
jgi:hypothetical protein